MNWAPLILAVVFATPAAVMLLHGQAPRAVAILAALAVLCLLAGVPSFLAEVGHPLPPGPVLLGIVAAALASATFFYLDVIRGHHKRPLKIGRKAIGGAAVGGAAQGGGGKGGHHARPLVASVGLAVFGLMIALNWPAVAAGVGGGFSQTVTTITHQHGA
jgi:hypothetical protein